ncbi:MAG: hypothetical protein F4Z72_11595 [Gemmatimonadales bacterium]|nr:hypothetical protein [Candidatus Palauibacter irciniicola]
MKRRIARSNYEAGRKHRIEFGGELLPVLRERAFAVPASIKPNSEAASVGESLSAECVENPLNHPSRSAFPVYRVNVVVVEKDVV